MKIKKLGHSCLVIEERDLKILTDPGSFTDTQNEITRINLILITHQHSDHLQIDSVVKVLANNPNVKIITNTEVGEILDKEQIKCEVIENGGSTIVSGVSIDGYGNEHYLLPNMVPVQNTGYLIAGKLFYPGDAFYNPNRDIQILALPLGGPWVKVQEAINYAKAINPESIFPVHDGMIDSPKDFYKEQTERFKEVGLKFISLGNNEEIEI